MLDRQQALEDPVVEARLAELVAVQDRVDAFPPFLEEPEQSGVCRPVVEALGRVHDAGGAVDAEPALAGAHPEPDRSADVVEARRATLRQRLLQPAAGDQLALADDLFRARHRLAGAKTRAEPVEG